MILMQWIRKDKELTWNKIIIKPLMESQKLYIYPTLLGLACNGLGVGGSAHFHH